MSSDRNPAVAIVLVSLISSLVAIPAVAEPLRATGSIDGLAPEEAKARILAILFPENLVQQAKDCKQLVDAGLPCGSVIPRPALETNQITFDRGKATLTEQSKAYLDLMGAALKSKKDAFVNVVIEGHTDATGSADLNRTLSKKRAETVKNYLSSTFGIANLDTVGRASDVLKDKSNPGAAVNRRIEFVITLPGQQ